MEFCLVEQCVLHLFRAWDVCKADARTVDYVRQYGGWDKPLRLTQTGWPSNDSVRRLSSFHLRSELITEKQVWKANSPNAVASIESEKAYFDLLDSRCGDFKKSNSVGWFAHLYSDNDLPGWCVSIPL